VADIPCPPFPSYPALPLSIVNQGIVLSAVKLAHRQIHYRTRSL
jgi:hypothetical protein